jgi:hypothetical protein
MTTAASDRQHDSEVRKGWIRDARRRKVWQLDPVALQVLQHREPIDRDTLSRILGEKGVGLSKLERGAMITCLIVIAAFIATVAGKYMLGTSPFDMLKRAGPTIYIFILPFIMWGHARKNRIDSIATAMLKHRRCPHCGYDLNGLPVSATDGATVCSECGCAWIVEQPATPSS